MNRYAHEIPAPNILQAWLPLGSMTTCLSSPRMVPIVGTTSRKLGLTFQEVPHQELLTPNPSHLGFGNIQTSFSICNPKETDSLG